MKHAAPRTARDLAVDLSAVFRLGRGASGRHRAQPEARPASALTLITVPRGDRP
jgi:hypothetical protein